MHGASHDIWSVNTDFEYYEEQRIEVRARQAEVVAVPPVLAGNYSPVRDWQTKPASDAREEKSAVVR